MIASSIINSKGINDITNIIGGYDSISLCIE